MATSPIEMPTVPVTMIGFLHIQRTGGNSLKKLFADCLGESKILRHRAGMPHSWYIHQCAATHSSKIMYQGHFSQAFAKRIAVGLNRSALNVSVVRAPESRLESQYKYIIDSPGRLSSNKHRRLSTVSSTLSETLAKRGKFYSTEKNRMTSFFSADRSFESALRNIKAGNYLIGRSEDMKPFRDELAHVLDRPVGTLIHTNRSKDQPNHVALLPRDESLMEAVIGEDRKLYRAVGSLHAEVDVEFTIRLQADIGMLDARDEESDLSLSIMSAIEKMAFATHRKAITRECRSALLDEVYSALASLTPRSIRESGQLEYALAINAEAKGDSKAAIFHSRNATELVTDIPLFPLLHSFCLYRSKELDIALKTTDNLINNSPEFADAHHLRSRVLRRMNRREEAVHSARAAVQLLPGIHEFESNLSELDSN